MLHKKFRILILLLVLLFVATSTLYSRLKTTDWDETLYIAIYPVNADGSEASARQIAQLHEEQFADIEQYFAREAIRYTQTTVKPIELEIAPEVTSLPPALERNGNALQAAWWSLQLRWWAWQHETASVPPDIQVYLLYHDANEYSVLDHSIGLQKGLVSVVKVFSGRQHGKRNNVVIAHELLHTVGATDKYDIASNTPLYPHGYAAPEQQPLYPQKRAEIMGGRIPLSASSFRQPDSLWQTVIGPATALEIGWK